MKILVGNNALSAIGGSETYTYALVEELVRRNHEVICASPRINGIVAHKIRELGVTVYNKPLNEKFDAMFMSHSTSLRLIYKCKGFKVQTCHGIYPRVEQPVKGMDAYVSISEEVHEHLKKKGFDSIIIRNGVNCERFNDKFPINNEINSILSLSHNKIVNDFLAPICKQLNVDLIRRNKFHMAKWDVETYIQHADLVVSLGRGCYESMAMGRNVLIYDNRKYSGKGSIGDGMVNEENVKLFLQNNCSGRYSNKTFDEESFIQELDKYDKNTGHKLREFAINNLNIVHQAEKYLNLVR